MLGGMKNPSRVRAGIGKHWIALGLLLLSACVAPPASRAQSLASKGLHAEAVAVFTRAISEADLPLERVSLLSGRAESKRALGDAQGAEADSAEAEALEAKVAADVERVVRTLDALNGGHSLFGTNRDHARKAVEECFVVSLSGPRGPTVVISPEGTVRVDGELVLPPEESDR